MPFFERNPLQQLALQPDEADIQLNLRGLPVAQAMAAVEELINTPNPGKTCLIFFTGAANDGRETLFLPLGRRLLQARREGLLARCLPAEDGASYFIAFPQPD